MKKKLVYILHSIEIGGVEVALLSALRKLKEHFDFTIVVLGHVNKRLIENFSPEEQAIFASFDFAIYTYPFRLKEIIHFIESKTPDVVISSLWRASMVGISLKKRNSRLLFVSFIHSTAFPHFLAKYYNIKAAKVADCVLTDSQSTYEFVQRTFQTQAPVRKISLLTNETPQKCLARSIASDQHIRFLFLGRIIPVKNLPLAIRLLADLKSQGFKISLDVYGRKDVGYKDAQKMVDSCKMQNEVIFHGAIDPQEKFRLFDQYHFLIQLSEYEGMAMSVAEAMQYGLPAIVTPVGEIPNYAADMHSAIFVDIDDKSKWHGNIKKIGQVISDPALYTALSRTAHHNFKSQTIFSTSIIDLIEEIGRYPKP